MVKKILYLIIWSISGKYGRIKIARKQGVKIGSGCEIFRNVNFGSEPYLITIGNNVRVTSGVKFCTHDGGLWTLRKLGKVSNADIFGTIEIGDNVHIGWNSIIMPNVKIGKNSIIGCGAVVTKDIPDNSVVAGVPAKVIKSLDEYYDNNKNKIVLTANMNPAEKKDFILNMMKDNIEDVK